jgi:hypothetical protein
MIQPAQEFSLTLSRSLLLNAQCNTQGRNHIQDRAAMAWKSLKAVVIPNRSRSFSAGNGRMPPVINVITLVGAVSQFI